MKCPVCDRENTSMLCRQCGFDSSRDYGKYPTFGSIGKVSSLSSLKKEWAIQQIPLNPVKLPKPIPVIADTTAPVEKTRKKMPWFTILACVATLILGILIGTRTSGGQSDLTEPIENMQVHTLRSDVPLLNEYVYTGDDTACAYPVFGSKYRRDEIASVQFLDTLIDAPANTWDLSQEADGSILAWVVPNGELYDLYIGADGIILAPENCRGLFAGYLFAYVIDFGSAFQTYNTHDMCEMFSDCDVLTKLDLSSFDTSKVQDMSKMFNSCNALTELNLSSFDTSNVQDMKKMFFGCNALEKLNLSNFDTSNVQNMHDFFAFCSALTELNLSNFDTSNVQDMGSMFAYCDSITELILSSSFDTSNVLDMNKMFYDCSSLKNLNLSSFDTSNVQCMDKMFYNCPAGDDWKHLLR